MLEIRDVSKSYTGKRALNHVSLKLGPGEIVGLFGENGAGKTTLMKCILGYVHHHGDIVLDQAPITRKNIEKFSFATSEHSFFPNLNAQSHKVFYEMQFSTFNERRFDGLIDFFELLRYKAIRHFSEGQKNQFEVILALSQGADYIFMDEPFAGNDVFNREDFYKVLLGILEPHETILLSTHLLEEVGGFIDRAILIQKGEVIGDVSMEAIESSGKTLIEHVKETYHYKSDRVSKALSDLTDQL